MDVPVEVHIQLQAEKEFWIGQQVMPPTVLARCHKCSIVSTLTTTDSIILLQVLTAVVQYVCEAAVFAGEATQAQLGGESDLEPGAEAELAAATALLQAIIAQE